MLAIGVATFSVGGRGLKQFSACVSHSLLVVAISTKWSLRAVNALSIFKVLSLVLLVLFMRPFPQPGLITIRVRSVAVTGVAVLAGFTRVSDPFENFHNAWQGSTINPNALATALVKTNFAYVGSANSFNLLGEVHGTNPVRTVRNAGFISLGIVTILFVTVNIAYIAAVPLDEIKGSGQLVGALFFQHVFGTHWASKILPVLVAFSCVGNIVSPIFDISYSAPADVLVWFTDGCCECLCMLRPTLSRE